MFKIIFTSKLFWIVGGIILSLCVLLKFDFKKISKFASLVWKIIKNIGLIITSIIFSPLVKNFQEDSGQ